MTRGRPGMGRAGLYLSQNGTGGKPPYSFTEGDTLRPTGDLSIGDP